jgi:hypothetical protein
VSLYLALAGQRSCGCFGRMTVSPWLTLIFDIAAMAALVPWWHHQCNTVTCMLYTQSCKDNCNCANNTSNKQCECATKPAN